MTCPSLCNRAMTADCSWGIRNSTNSRLGRNCVPISASSAGMPSPVVAEMATACGYFSRNRFSISPRTPPLAEPVHLVENHQRGFFVRADFLEHGIHRRDLLLGLRMADVHDVQQQIRPHNFLQRGLERLNQPVRQFLDEADRVSQ